MIKIISLGLDVNPLDDVSEINGRLRCVAKSVGGEVIESPVFDLPPGDYVVADTITQVRPTSSHIAYMLMIFQARKLGQCFTIVTPNLQGLDRRIYMLADEVESRE